MHESSLLLCSLQDLPTSDVKEILFKRLLEEYLKRGNVIYCHTFSPPPPPPPPSGASGASGTIGASDSAQAPPPTPPSSSTHQEDQSTSIAAPCSSKTAASAEYSAWTMTDTWIKPSITTILDDLYMDDETTADEQAYSSGEEVGCDHIPIVNLRQSWWKPLTEDRPASPKPAWTIPSSNFPVPTNNWASALKTTYVPPPENSLLARRSSPVTRMGKNQQASHDKVDDAIITSGVSSIRSQDWLTSLVYLKDEGAFYPVVGLKQLGTCSVLDCRGGQVWTSLRCLGNLSMVVSRQRFYIDRFYMKEDRRAVHGNHMRVLSVVLNRSYSQCIGYNYMKEDHHSSWLISKEYVIAKGIS
ncbi:hypothetical protein Tco_0885526 [Tanacetum coccineum]